MSNKNQKPSNGNQNTTNVENVFRLINKTDEQLTASASRYNERAECGQVITFERAEQKKAVGAAANADADGYLAGIFWSGYVVTTDGQRHEFSRLDSNGIARHFANVCTWKRATRGTLLDGNATRTAEQRAEDARKAIAEAQSKPAPNSVTAIVWEILGEATCRVNGCETPAMDELSFRIRAIMENNDTTAAEKASAKESKTAQRERELAEAKQAAAAAEDTNRKMIAALLATGQYKDENEIREKLGL